MKILSNCCNADTKIIGISGETMYYQCTKCGESCDIKIEEEENESENKSEMYRNNQEV